MNTKTIPSRRDILLYLAEHPTTMKSVVEHFLVPQEFANDCQGRLQKMLDEQHIITQKDILYCNITKERKGTVVAHPRGFGFLSLENEENDWFINKESMRFLLPGEAVSAMPVITRKGTEAIVLRHERLLSNVTGQMKQENDKQLFSVDGIQWLPAEFYTVEGDLFDFQQREQSWIVVDGIDSPSAIHPHRFVVRSLLGPQKTFDPLRYQCLHQRGFKAAYTPDVLEQAMALCSMAPTAKTNKKQIPFISIDGPSSRDLDDLIFIEKNIDGYRVVVAIADVSSVVLPDSAVDAHARQMGTSVYTPGRSFPMLPPVIANEMCSLLPNAERSALVLDMQVSEGGQVESFQFEEAQVISKHRFTYERVQELLSNGYPTSSERPFLDMLQDLSSFCEARIEEKEKHQTMSFPRKDTIPLFDADGDIVDFSTASHYRSQRYIEELMILANTTAGQFLWDNLGYGIFRHHDGIDPEKLPALNDWLSQFDINPLSASSTMNDCHCTHQQLPEEQKSEFEQRLRGSLVPAHYDPANSHHFGLGLPYYAHFTSPIRRYADLLTHRLIKYCLAQQGKSLSGEQHYTHNDLVPLTMHLSDRAYQSMLVERNIMDGIACRWWSKNHLPGEPIPGVIAGQSQHFLFVQLAHTPAQGALAIDEFSSEETVPQRGDCLDVFIETIDVRVRRIKVTSIRG